MVFLVYEVQIRKKYFPMYTLETASIFATYPIDLSDSNVLFYFVDEVFATALFIIMVLAITDKKNDLQQPFVALFIGLALLTIGTSYGYNSGFALNPVRDFWPRVFTSLAGWGSSPFTACNYFFWIPLVGPMVGSLIATIIYSLFISNHHRFESFQQF
jgi:glycerol uptake facilitator-like aquaporin